MNKKILMVLDNAFKPDLRVQKEIQTLTSLGFSVHLFCWDKDSDLPETVDDGKLKITRIKVKTRTQMGLGQIRKLLEFYKYLFQMISRDKIDFDYIYAHDFLMLPAGVLLKFHYKKPLIYDAHEIYHIMEWEKYNAFFRNLIFFIERFLLRFADHFIVVSQIRKDFYQKYFKKDIAVLGNWYDPPADEQVDLRKKFNIPDNSLVFGYFGGLNRKVRSLDYIINSVLEIPESHLIIAGSGHDSSYVEQCAKENERIHFLGWLEDVRKYFNSVDYVLYFINADRKYFKFAAPNTLYLSISHGIPLITNTPGEAEFLISKFNIGFFIEKDEKLINRIELDRRSPAYKEKVDNIKNIRNNYSWSKSSEIYSKLFYEGLEHRNIHVGSAQKKFN